MGDDVVKSRDAALVDFKINLRACVLPEKGGVPIGSLPRVYKELVGRALPLHDFGFGSVEEMARALSDVVSLSYGPEGPVVVCVADESTAHLARMVSSQRCAKRAPTRGRGTRGFRGMSYAPRSFSYRGQRPPAPASGQLGRINLWPRGCRGNASHPRGFPPPRGQRAGYIRAGYPRFVGPGPRPGQGQPTFGGAFQATQRMAFSGASDAQAVPSVGSHHEVLPLMHVPMHPEVHAMAGGGSQHYERGPGRGRGGTVPRFVRSSTAPCISEPAVAVSAPTGGGGGGLAHNEWLFVEEDQGSRLAMVRPSQLDSTPDYCPGKAGGARDSEPGSGTCTEEPPSRSSARVAGDLIAEPTEVGGAAAAEMNSKLSADLLAAAAYHDDDDGARLYTDRVREILIDANCPAVFNHRVEEMYEERFGSRLPRGWCELMDPLQVTVAPTLLDRKILFVTKDAPVAPPASPPRPVPVSVPAPAPPPAFLPAPAPAPWKRREALEFPKTPWPVTIPRITGNAALIRIVDEGIAKKLDEAIRVVWNDEAGRAELAFRPDVVPAVDSDVVVRTDDGYFERAVVLENDRYPFLDVYLTDRGVEYEVHFENAMRPPPDLPTCPPMSFWTKLWLFADFAKDDPVAEAVLHNALVDHERLLWAFVLDPKYPRILTDEEVDPGWSGTSVVIVDTADEEQGDGPPLEVALNKAAKDLIRSTYGLADLMHCKRETPYGGRLVAVLTSGHVVVVLDDDLASLVALNVSVKYLDDCLDPREDLPVGVVYPHRVYLVRNTPVTVKHLLGVDEQVVDVFRATFVKPARGPAGGVDDGKYEMFAVDFGAFVVVSPSDVYDLHQLSPRLAAIPWKAQLCILDGVPVPGTDSANHIRRLVVASGWLGRRVRVVVPHSVYLLDGGADRVSDTFTVNLDPTNTPRVRLELELELEQAEDGGGGGAPKQTVCVNAAVREKLRFVTVGASEGGTINLNVEARPFFPHQRH